MAKWVDGTVVENKQWTDNLHSLRVSADIAPFVAGQFTRLALDIDGEEVSRPFSLVNSPEEAMLDFYFIEVPEGKLSPRLAALKTGDSVKVAAKAAGLMTLAQLAPAKKLFLLSTGTGVGPFISMIKTTLIWQQFEQVTLVHAVRYQNELSYPEIIESVRQRYPDQFYYLPMVSREPAEGALSGRIPQAIESQAIEQLSAKIDTDSQVLLCGNPDMVNDTMDVLVKRGLTRHTRREPGQIIIEKYW